MNNLLPDELNRFFFDADIILKKNLPMIYNINVKNKVLVTVQDVYSYFSKSVRNVINLKDQIIILIRES
jgi:lipopolysaccharide biosynthesis glycosyltransferase